MNRKLWQLFINELTDNSLIRRRRHQQCVADDCFDRYMDRCVRALRCYIMRDVARTVNAYFSANEATRVTSIE